MPFDPDAYLSNKSEAPAPAGFDPDAYLAKSGEAEAPSREQEIRRERLQRLLAPGEPGYGARIKDNVTSGLMRPIGGAMSVVGGKASELFGGKPATAGEYWRGGVGAEEDYIKRAEKNTPGALGTAADVAGSLIGAGKATKAVGLGKQAIQAGVQGAIEGGARNSEDVGSAAGGAAMGGAISAGGSALLGGLLDRLKGVSGAKTDIGVASRGGNAQTLQHEGSEIYKKLDDAGIKYSARETTPIAQDMVDKLSKAGYDKAIHKDLNEIVGDLGALSGNSATWTQLQNMRTRIGTAKASDDKNVRRMAGELGDVLDNFIDKAKPTMPARSVGQVDPAKDVVEARDLWKRGSQADTVENLAEKGTRLAKDPTAKVQKNFERYSDRVSQPGKYNPNSPEQMRLMDEIVRDEPGKRQLAEVMSKFGTRLGQFGLLGAAGTAAGPLTGSYDVTDKTGGTIAGTLATAAALKGGSSVMRRAIAEQGAAKVNDLLRNIVTGSTKQGPGAYIPRDALAKILAAQDTARGAGNYAGSFVNRD